MRIERQTPPPPPQEFVMAFTKDEGWAVVAAINYFAEMHAEAMDRDKWLRWAKDLDRILR